MKKKSKGKSITFNKDRVVPSRKILGIAFALFAVLFFISISDYNIGQFKANNTNLTDINLIGDFGAYISNYGFNFFGSALWLVPVILILLSYNFFREQKRGIRLKQFVLAFISLISLSAIFSILQGMNKINFLREVMEQKLFLGDLGGHLGRFFKITALSPFGPLGSLLISSFFFVGSLYLILGDNLIILSQFLARKIKYIAELLLSFLKKFFLNLGKTLRYFWAWVAKLCNGFVKLLSLKNFIKNENVKPPLKNLNE